jgi:hypothetical protein
MSLAQRQRNLALATVLEAVLKGGTPPDQAQIETELAELLPAALGSPSFTLREQNRRSTFRVDWQNTMFAEAATDLGLLYAENIDVLERLLMHLGLAEVNGRRLGQELRALQNSLDQQLLTASRGTNFFISVFDRFTNLNKIDQTRSNVGADVTTGMITLAPEASTTRIQMPHMLNSVAAPVALLAPQRGIVQPVPGAPFGNAFQDLLSAWQVSILTETNEPVEVAVTIDLVPPTLGTNQQPRAPVEITQIRLHGLSAMPYTVLPLWSSDGVAFSYFNQLSVPILADEEVVVINVDPTEVTSIQLRLRKEGPDGTEETAVKVLEKRDIPAVYDANGELVSPARTEEVEVDATRQFFSTVFAFSQISFWRMGYKRRSTLVSQLLVPEDSDNLQTISKVSLSVDEELPQGATIRYEVSGFPGTENFVPITPIGRDASIAPSVVDFTKAQVANRHDNAFTISTGSPPTTLGTIRGTEFFAIRTVTDASVFKTVRLFRGRNAWHCENTTVAQNKSVRNLYLDFTGKSTVPLYLFEEDERIPVHPSNDGTEEIEISTRFRVLLTGDTFNETEDLEAPNDTVAKYAVRKLIRRPVGGSLDETALSGSIVNFTARKDVASTGFTAQPSSPTAGRLGALIGITAFASGGLLADNTAGNKPDLIGQPIRVSYVNNSLTVTGVFEILTAQILSNGGLLMSVDDPTDIIESANAAASATWEILAVNITGSINNIDGTSIRLDQSQQIGASDVLEVTYRRRLLPTESPISSTLSLKATADSTTSYIEGTDYTFDHATRTVARLSSGSIPSTSDGTITARADFDYEEQTQGLVSYRTYLFNSQATPKLRLEKILVDRENGEEVLLQTASGFLDLHDRDELPALPPGQHQLIVRSNPIKNPNGTVNLTSAIYKAISIRELRSDSDTGRFLLPAHEHPSAVGATGDNFAGYFTRQEAFPAPMQQVSFRQLSTNTRKTDHAVFAVKRAAETPATATDVVVVNFDPRTSTDVLYLPPDLSALGTTPLLREDFALEYVFIPTAVEALTGIKLRATLERGVDTDGSVTPILRGYTIRVSY